MCPSALIMRNILASSRLSPRCCNGGHVIVAQKLGTAAADEQVPSADDSRCAVRDLHRDLIRRPCRPALKGGTVIAITPDGPGPYAEAYGMTNPPRHKTTRGDAGMVGAC